MSRDAPNDTKRLEPWLPSESWELAPEATDVWLLDWAMDAPCGGSNSVVDAWAEGLLDAGERERASRLVIPAKRRQFARSRAALRAILGKSLGVDPRSLNFGYGQNGRPEHDQLLFNLSHSGTVAVITVGASGTKRLGVDVERVEAHRPVDRLVERFFAPSEVEVFRRGEAPARAADFARRWALKEAYVKALGTGLTYPSRQFALLDDAVSWRPRPLLASCLRHGEAHLAWSFHNSWIDVGDERFALAVCSDLDAPARRFRFEFEADPE